MKTNSKKGLIIFLSVLILILGAAVAGMAWFLGNHIFVDGRPYRSNAQELDLRNKKLTVEEYEAIRAELPDCRITWNVPFQNTSYPDDTTSLSVSSLSAEDMQMLSYFPTLQALDASGCRDYEMLMQLKERYPDLELTYTVNIGGTDYVNTATEVVATELSEEEIALLAYLPSLQTVDATACSDTTRLTAVSAAYPSVKLLYKVELLGKSFTQDVTEAKFDKPAVSELLARMPGLTSLKTVHLVEPNGTPEELRELMAACPDMTITWDKTVLGKTFHSGETEYDLTDLSLVSGRLTKWTATPMSAAETSELIKTVEEAMAYFPNAEKVILPAYYLDNETMGAFREKMRPEYKVVWSVYITRQPVRTDKEVIHSSAMGVCLIDEQSYDLKYCEDAVVVDIGHSYVKYIEWVRYMPKLRFLILTHNWIKDLTPISTCKNLEYLEIYWNKHIPDYSPLVGCTALRDLNLSGTYADPTPLYQMTWLETLWANNTTFTAEEQQKLRDSLPDTFIHIKAADYTAGGWREVPRYFEMRDIMGLGYNRW